MNRPDTPAGGVLLAGFEPFDRDTVNPSWEAVRALAGERIEGQLVQALQLPCVFGRAIEVLEAQLDAQRPALVIGVGQAGGRAEITPERIAINVDDGRICDNAGCQPIDRPVVPGGPAAYFSSLPIKAMVQALREKGLPAAVSNTAGTFVCNHLFYALMHRIATRPVAPGMRGGFIHIPDLPQQVASGAAAGLPSLPLDRVVEGLRIAVGVALRRREDLRAEGGALN